MIVPFLFDCEWCTLIYKLKYDVSVVFPSLNLGHSSWDLRCCTSDHSLWVQVSWFIRDMSLIACFAFVRRCACIYLCFLLFCLLWSPPSGGVCGRLGDRWDAISTLRSMLLDKSKHRMIKSYVIRWHWITNDVALVLIMLWSVFESRIWSSERLGFDQIYLYFRFIIDFN